MKNKNNMHQYYTTSPEVTGPVLIKQGRVHLTAAQLEELFNKRTAHIIRTKN